MRSRPTLANPTFLALKAGLAAALALLLDGLLGNPDHVSSTFIATLCVSPTVLMGLRRATSQLTGSIAGGLLGAAAMAVGLAPIYGVPLAVAAAVGLALAVRLPMGYPVAAFSALIVQLVPWGGPLETLEVRLLAVLIAGVSGFVVNVLVTSHAYTTVFRGRLAVSRARVVAALPAAVLRGPDGVQPTFQLLAEANSEMDLAIEELRWRRAREPCSVVADQRNELLRLRNLLHVASELGLRRIELQLDEAAVAPFASWLGSSAATAEAPPVADDLSAARNRLMAALQRLDMLPG